MGIKERLARIVRVISIPPISVSAMFLILYLSQDAVFQSVAELLVSLLLLMVIPVLAYPLAGVIPGYKEQGREGQRKLAFVLTPVGYTAAVAYGLLAHVSRPLMVIYLAYFGSIIALLVFNKLIGLRASGHACSIAGPLIATVSFIGWQWLLPSILFFVIVIWASLVLKRHTPRELFLGSLSAFVSFGLGSLLVGTI